MSPASASCTDTRRPPGGAWVSTTSAGNADGAGSGWMAPWADRGTVVITNDTLQHGTDSAVPTTWRRCRPGAKNLAQVPFSLARDSRSVEKDLGRNRLTCGGSVTPAVI